jgi:hypothetical protein
VLKWDLEVRRAIWGAVSARLMRLLAELEREGSL